VTTRIAFLPISPMLFGELATGAADEVSEVRSAAQRAVAWAGQGRRVGILTPDEPVNAQSWSLTGFGVTIERGTPVGLAEAVARRFLAGRQAVAVGPGANLAAFDCLLVMGDGSSSRSEKAPGHINDLAVPFDAAILAAITAGDASALSRLDLHVAQQVGAAGAPAWIALARQTVTVDSAVVDLASDPFGVLYIVARWTARLAGPA
jgi:hypothetical protein